MQIMFLSSNDKDQVFEKTESIFVTQISRHTSIRSTIDETNTHNRFSIFHSNKYTNEYKDQR